MGKTMQATDYCGYLLVSAFYGLLPVTVVTYWLVLFMVYYLLPWLLTG
jgi:hypothetical protein